MMKRPRISLSKTVSVLVFVALLCLQTPSFAAQDESIGSVRDIYNGTLSRYTRLLFFDGAELWLWEVPHWILKMTMGLIQR